MTRPTLVVVLLLCGCANRAIIKGTPSNPSAQIESATFSHEDENVVVEVQLGLEGREGEARTQVLLRTQLPCRAGKVEPPPRFRLTYVTLIPPTMSNLFVNEWFLTVHRCEGAILDFSGGWYVEGTISTILEVPYPRPNPPIPISHVELVHVTPAQVEPDPRVW